MLRLGTATEISFRPQLVMFLLGKMIKQIGCSFSCTFALSDDKIWSWGTNTHGILGTKDSNLNSVSYYEINELQRRNICCIKSNGYCAFALSNLGEAYYWGEGKGYKTCIESNEDLYIPMKADSLKNYKVHQIGLGIDSTIILGCQNQLVDHSTMEELKSLVNEINEQVKEVEAITKLLKITNRIENGQVCKILFFFVFGILFQLFKKRVIY